MRQNNTVSLLGCIIISEIVQGLIARSVQTQKVMFAATLAEYEKINKGT